MASCAAAVTRSVAVGRVQPPGALRSRPTVRGPRAATRYPRDWEMLESVVVSAGLLASAGDEGWMLSTGVVTGEV